MATSATQKHYLGIDIGSVSYSYVLMDQKGQIIQSDYRIHNGNIFNLLKEQLAKIELSRVQQIAYNHKAADFFNQGISVNEQVALIEGVRFQVQDVGSVFSIHSGLYYSMKIINIKNSLPIHPVLPAPVRFWISRLNGLGLLTALKSANWRKPFPASRLKLPPAVQYLQKPISSIASSRVIRLKLYLTGSAKGWLRILPIPWLNVLLYASL
jgi:hypothetical protein